MPGSRLYYWVHSLSRLIPVYCLLHCLLMNDSLYCEQQELEGVVGCTCTPGVFFLSWDVLSFFVGLSTWVHQVL